MLLNADREPATQSGLRTNNILICKLTLLSHRSAVLTVKYVGSRTVTIFNYVKVQRQC